MAPVVGYFRPTSWLAGPGNRARPGRRDDRPLPTPSRGSCQTQRMPIIQVHNASPSSIEKKRELVAALTATYAQVMGIRPDTIRVILHEVPRKNWSVAGVTLAASGQDEAV